MGLFGYQLTQRKKKMQTYTEYFVDMLAKVQNSPMKIINKKQANSMAEQDIARSE